MRVLLAFAARHNWPVIYNFDFVAVYLNAPIDKEVWVKAPEGLDVQDGKACLLDKALYGTKCKPCGAGGNTSAQLLTLLVTSQVTMIPASTH
jgi:hypothetical protein